jgi:hypothetical protein
LHKRIDALAAHHASRCEAILAVCDVPKTAVQLIPVLFRRALDRHQMGFALGEGLAHLNYLMHQGALDRALGADGAYHFVRPRA